jgi:uncharacterized membrane protein YgdD (TMEM256/DUF423 family)
MSESVGEAFPKEQQRLRELLAIYRGLEGGVGAFGAAGIEQTLQRADQAMASGDVVAIVQAFAEMQGWQE